MSQDRPNAVQRLFRGETTFDFANRWKIWFAISGTIILIGIVSLGVRGLNFSIDFKGGTIWEVPTTASVAHTRTVVGNVSSGLRQANIEVLFNRETNKRTIEVQASAKDTASNTVVSGVTDALAKMAGVPTQDVEVNAVGPSWGSSITKKAIEAVIIFLVIVSIYIWLRFEAKMAVAVLIALVQDMLITIGIYSLSGFQVSPDTIIAFLTILGYALYDAMVVFDKVQENTRGLASSNRLTYTDVVNLSMNNVLARSVNTSFVAIVPILSILVVGAGILGATALNDFGLALFVGLGVGAYSSIFIASPLLALLKEREPRYAEIRRRMASTNRASTRLTPAEAAVLTAEVVTGAGPDVSPRPRPPARPRRAGTAVGSSGSGGVRTAAPPRPRAPVRQGPRPSPHSSRSPEPASKRTAPTSPVPRDEPEKGPADPGLSAPEVEDAPRSTPSPSTPAVPTPPRAASRPPAPPPGSTPPAPGGAPARPSNRPPPRPRKKTRRH
ncbi:MAG: protein translocase subunit SecF [Acidimicrobiales bacterium]